MNPGPVIPRRIVQTSKSGPLVDKEELIDSNSSVATVKYSCGKESSVSVRGFPCPSAVTEQLLTRDSSPYPFTPLLKVDSVPKHVELQRFFRPPDHIGIGF
ncbi:unnamed protein product [Lepeophtheirus salmonis]|uniref:(salmon louse) hypothetical protein n=1 Tax=Lepeophtheirus salmonis TaxID=72036 RepID=A0A7R8CL47_LEPSM|nr:unnamed protein product [Lepeophtheirus salmonis]CAF2853491.1 unnamed protein product [Lepeophtheirus salmonis]